LGPTLAVSPDFMHDNESVYAQNVKPEKLFTKERAIKQLLDIIDKTTMEENGKFFAWDGQEVPF